MSGWAGGLGVPCTRNRLYAGATAGEGVSSFGFQATSALMKSCPPGLQVHRGLSEESSPVLCHGNPARPGREQRYRGLRALGGLRDGCAVWVLGPERGHRPRCARHRLNQFSENNNHFCTLQKSRIPEHQDSQPHSSFLVFLLRFSEPHEDDLNAQQTKCNCGQSQMLF